MRVFLAGRVAVEANGDVIDERRFPGRQGRLLFAYLVAEQGRAVPRDELAEALWGEAPPASWEKALTVLVSKLRTLLADHGIDGASALSGAFGCYRLDLPEGTWVDVVAAASASQEAEEALAAGDLAEARETAELAASLTRQPLLPGDDGAWVDGKRRELADVHVRALNVLADACLLSGDAREAAKWAEQAIKLEPFLESGYRRLMEAHVASGNRAEALRVYERCRRLLAEDIGTYPSPETEAIYRGLLEAPSVHTEAAGEAPPPEPGVGAGESGGVVRRRRTILALVAAGVVLAAGVVTYVLAVMVPSGGGSGAPASASKSANAVGAFDASTGRVVGSTRLEASPSSIAYGQNSVWVTLSSQNAISRIDPQTNQVVQTIGVGNGPAAVAVGGGFVWVANSLDGTVWQIDPRTNGGQVVDKIAVGNGPTGVAFGLGAVWVANSIDHTVVRIDPRTGKPGASIPVEAGADAIAAGDGAVWVTSRSAGVLSRIDPASRTATPINVGNGPTAVATASKGVWVANGQDGTAWRIDPATSRVVDTVVVGEGPSGVAVATRSQSVWVSNALSGTLSKIDSTRGKVVESVPVGDQPQGVAVGPDRAYVAVQEAASTHRGGTLTVAVANPANVYQGGIAKALDPASGYAEEELLTLTNDGLLGYGRSGGAEGYRVVPDLAVALPTVSDGGRTYTFQLRPGIRYSTGVVVQPADIRRGIERALLTSGKATPASYLIGIVGASGCVAAPTRCDFSKGIVTDPRSNTVTIHLTTPDPDFLYKLALPLADAVPASTSRDARPPLPATGPYKVAGYDAKRGMIRLVRNPHFRLWSSAAQPAGFPDQIVVRYGYTGASAVRAVERGAADVTADGPEQTWTPALASSLRTRHSSRLFSAPNAASTAVWLNTRLAPFDDVRVRRALNFAIDRNRLLELAGGPGTAEVGCQVLPPNTEGYRRYCPYTLHPNKAGTYAGPDLARARRLVAASGTKGQPVTIWFYDIPIGRRNGEYIVSVLRSLGYKARLRTVPQSGVTWRPDRQAGVGGWGSDYPAASNFFVPLFTCRSYTGDLSTNENGSEFCNRHIDGEIARAGALQTVDPRAASRLWTKIDHEITDLAPWVVIRTGIATDFVSRRTGNYTSCWLSYWNGSTAACLDRLWVR
jgi:peptide/nickel transport system substrate-binding protein